MKRLIEKTVFSGLVTACRLATVPTRRSPDLAKATTDGVVRPPSAFSMTVGSPPSSTAMHEFVVPRSMPMVLPIRLLLAGEKRFPVERLRQPSGKNLSRVDADSSVPPRAKIVRSTDRESARRRIDRPPGAVEG